jgi:hypothetical protein
MTSRLERMTPASFASAALVMGAFLIALAVLHAVSPPTAIELAASDPLVQSLDAIAGPWLTLLLGAGVIALWLPRLVRAELASAVRHAAVGVGAAIAVALAIRVLVGPQLPAFVPPEESAAPGLTLSLNAGLCEELVFRLAVLPVAFFALRDRIGARGAMVAGIVVTSSMFALSHELPPAGGDFMPLFVATRFVIPGAMMSIACFAVSPSFIVAAHGAAHVVIPALF